MVRQRYGVGTQGMVPRLPRPETKEERMAPFDVLGVLGAIVEFVIGLTLLIAILCMAGDMSKAVKLLRELVIYERRGRDQITPDEVKRKGL